MDKQRFIRVGLLLVFAFSTVSLMESWYQEHAPTTSIVKPSAVPETSSTPAASPQKTVAADQVQPEATEAMQLITVNTDVIHAVISTRGGDITSLDLLRHKSTLDADKIFTLFEQDAKTYVAQSGVTRSDGLDYPNHHSIWRYVGQATELQSQTRPLSVTLEAEQNKLRVLKTYTFNPGSYVIDLKYTFVNGSDHPIRPSVYYQFLRDDSTPAENIRFVNVYTGPAFYSPEHKFQKESFDDIDKASKPFSETTPTGWAAIVQHYFVGAWLPPTKTDLAFYAKKGEDHLYRVGFISNLNATLEPGATMAVDARLYAGPQEQKKLVDIAPGLELVTDYGWLTIFAAPLFSFLQFLHKLSGNWGWAIILLTISVKLAFFPLSAASYRSMAKMKAVGPRMQALKDRYANDKQKLNMELMSLFKQEKINPMAGCLPVVIQIPVFIALYSVLLASVEMRHAPWLGWIHDLSSKDPLFILPVIMGITMFIQTKLNPAPTDPIQAKVMLVMPLVFSVMFFFFPSGLVLYWVVNNILSIAQQWYITRQASRKHRPANDAN